MPRPQRTLEEKLEAKEYKIYVKNQRLLAVPPKSLYEFLEHRALWKRMILLRKIGQEEEAKEMERIILRKIAREEEAKQMERINAEKASETAK